jgi:hypothetical protein
MEHDNNSTALAHRNGTAVARSGEVDASDFMPLMTVVQAVERKNQVNQFIKKVLVEGEDYGQIPGTNTKKVLLKPGGEKLCSIFGLAPKYVKEVIVEDWTGENHGGESLFSYEYRCQLWRGDCFMGEAIASANSWEKKYRYIWVQEAQVPERFDKQNLVTRNSTMMEFAFAVEKGETAGQYGKPVEYWNRWRAAIQDGTARQTMKKTKNGREMPAWEMGGVQYRIPNQDTADLVNTLQKMAQKRALVAAVLVVTNCSDGFTQDLEDHAEENHGAPPVQQPPPDDPKPEAPPRLQTTDMKIIKDLSDYMATNPDTLKILSDNPAIRKLSPAGRTVATKMINDYATLQGYQWDNQVGKFVPIKREPGDDMIDYPTEPQNHSGDQQ